MDWLILEVMKALHRSKGSLIMYAWGRSRINEQKHPEIAWAADTHYLSHLAATLDNPSLAHPDKCCWSVNGCTVNEGMCACRSQSMCRKGALSMQRNADHGISLENFFASHDAALNRVAPNSTISRYFCSIFLQTTKSSKQLPARFIQSLIISLLITCWCVFLCRVGTRQFQPESTSPVKSPYPRKLHLLPEIWGADSTDTHWDILFLPAADSKHAPQTHPNTTDSTLLLE